MRAAVSLTDGLGLDGDRCIRVIPRQTPTYDFSEKLHEIEKILARRGDASLDPPLGRYGVLFLKHEIENNFVLAGDWG